MRPNSRPYFCHGNVTCSQDRFLTRCGNWTAAVLYINKQIDEHEGNSLCGSFPQVEACLHRGPWRAGWLAQPAGSQEVRTNSCNLVSKFLCLNWSYAYEVIACCSGSFLPSHAPRAMPKGGTQRRCVRLEQCQLE